MPWFRIDDGFESSPKVLAIPRGRVRLAAIGLWTSIGTWCARNLTDGVFSPDMVAEKGGTKADARWLLGVELWHEKGVGCGTETCPAGVPGMYRMHDYLDFNPSKVKVLAERAAAAARQQRARDKAKEKAEREAAEVDAAASRRDSRVSHGGSHGPPDPTRPDPYIAAAAETPQVGAVDAGSPPPLPPAIEILRGALEARKLVVRWDRLTVEQVTEVEQLIEVHGDGPLVASAMRDFQPNRPVAFAQAWLPSWRQIRKPGDLAAVADDCTEPGHTGTTRHCRECAAERKAAQ